MAAPMRDNPLDRAKGADPKTEPTSNFEYDDNEWDIGIGDLIIDLDADIEKTNERGGGGGGGSSSVVGGVSGSSGVNSGVGASVGGSGVGSGAGVTVRQQQHYGGMSAGATKGSSKMATAAVEHSATVDKGLKMKIKRTKPGTKTSEAKHEIVKAPGESAGTGVVGGSVVGGVGANSGPGLQNGDDTGKVSGKHPPQSSAPPPSSGSSSSSSGSSGSGSSSGGGSKRGSSGHRRDKARDKHSDKPPSKGSGSLGAPNGNVASAELNGVTTVPSPVAVTVLPSQGQNQVQHQGGQLQQVIQQSQDGHQVSAGSQGPQQQGNVPAVQHQIQSQVPQTSLSSSTGSSVVVSPVSGATASNANSSVAQNSQSHPTHSQMTPQISQLQIQQPQTQQLTQQHQHVPYPSGASSDGSGSGVPATGPIVVPVKVELVGGKSSLGSPAACGAVTSPATKCEEGEVTAPGGAAAGAALPVAASTPSSSGNSPGSSVSSVVSSSSATSVSTACGSTGSTTGSSSPPPSKKQKTSCEPKNSWNLVDSDYQEMDLAAAKDMLDVCVGTSVGTITEPDCLGPCEPGTSVTLEGIVWHETEGGVLVVNVTWRGKTYVGTLLDCTKHDWAPPRFCDSPTSDLDSRTAKGRGKRGRAAAAAAAAAATPSSDLSNFTETRSSVHSKLRNGGGKGRRGNGPSTVVPVGGVAVSGAGGASGTTGVVGFIPPRPEPGNKRKVRSTEGSDDAVGGVAVANGSGTGAGGKRSRSASRGPPSSPPSSPVLLECPEPNCSKKYKHINGLKYHQSHAHGAVGAVPSEEDDTKETASLSEAEESPVEAAPSPKTDGSLPGNQRQRACPTTPQSRQQAGDGASTPPTTPRTQPLPDASPDAKAVAQVKPGVLRFGPTAPEEQYSPAATEGGMYGNKTSTPASPIASGQHSVVGSIRVVGMPSLTSSPPHVNKQPPPSQVPSTPQHLPPHQQDAAKLGDKYKLKGSPVTPASSPARPVVNLQQPSIKALPTQQSQAHSVMQSPQQIPQGAKAVGIINEGQDKKEKCSGKGPPSGQQQQSPLPPVSHKKKNRKSPAGSPQPDQQGIPFNPALRDSSASMSSPVGGGEGREDVQSPAYSDISDDSAPVLESEVGEKGRGGQTVPVSVASSVQGGNAPPSVGKNSEKKAEVPNPPSGQNASSANSTAQHLAHYGMYPFYGQPPYLVPSVPPTSSSESKLSKEGTVVTAPSDKPGSMDPKGIPDRVAEKEKKEGVPVPPPSSVSGVSSSSTTPSSTGSTTSVMPPTSTTSTSVTDFQHKLMQHQQQQQQQQQHYYPYGYVPGYPYGLEPSYQVSVMADKYAVEAAAAAASAASLEKDKSSVEKLPPTSSGEIGSNCKGSSGNMHSSQKERSIKLEVGLKEKQNENHQILKESIEMKNQMNDGKAKYGGGSVPPSSSPYESGPYLFQRQQEELRRFYLYPPEQRRKESGPGGPLDATVSGAKPASSDIKPSISVPPPPKPITSSALPSPKSNSREHIRNEKCGNGSSDEKKESGGPDKSAIPKQEGVKPTMETQGPPPPTSYSYIHPGYMQSPHYGALPFDPVYRGLNQMLVPGPYGAGPYLHPQMRYHAPEDLSRPGVAAAAAAAAAAAVSAGPTKALDLLQHHASQYYSSHKIHELQERALKSPTPKTAPSPSGSVSGSSSTTCSQPPSGVVQSTGPSPTSIPKSQQAPPPPVAVGSGGPGGAVPPSGDGKEVGGGPGSGSVGGGGLRSPPPQRHVHTHHHTHVGLGYPLLAGQYGPAAPYGAVLASQQAAAVAATVINPYPPK